MGTITRGELEYLRELGFKPNDPISKGLIEARRVELRLSDTAKNLELALESAGTRVTDKLIASNDRAMANYARKLTVAMVCCAIGSVAVIAANLYIVSAMIADFRMDRNAGVDLASHFHMAPTELIRALAFIAETEYSNSGFWQWVEKDGKYFYSLYQNNGQSRCERPARMSEISGCFFRNPAEIKEP